jgi:hypothetical protein
MRKAIEKKTEVDLLVPVTLESITPEEVSDCFGLEFAARNSDCSLCADADLCQIVYTEKVKGKKLTLEIENGPMMDAVDFKGVNMKRIEALARKYQESDQPMTFEELQEVIRGEANTKDDEAVIQFIKRELPLTMMYLSEGLCKVR